MDEENQQTGSDTATKDTLIGDCEASAKRFVDEKVEDNLSRKNNSEVSSSTVLIEASNTNGVDKDSESHQSVSSHVNDSETSECQQGKTSTSSVCDKSNNELSVASENVDISLKECVDKQSNSEIHFSSVDSGNVDFNTENSNKNNVSDCEIREDSSGADKTMDVERSQQAEENSDIFCVNESKDVTADTVNQSETCTVEKEFLNSLIEKQNENTSIDSPKTSQNADILSASSEETSTKHEDSTQSKETVTEVLEEIKTDDILTKVNPDTEKCCNNKSTTGSDIVHVTDEENKEIKGDSTVETALPSEDSKKEEQISQEVELIEEPSNVINTNTNSIKEENECSKEPVHAAEDSQQEEQVSQETLSVQNSGYESIDLTDQENKDAEDLPSSKDSCEEVSQDDQETQKLSTCKSSELSNQQNDKDEEDSKPDKDVQEVPQEIQLDEESSKGEKEIENVTEIDPEEPASKEKGFSSHVNSDNEIIDSLDEKKSDRNDESRNLEVDSSKLISNVENSTEKIVNTVDVSADTEEENVNKCSTSEGNEIMDTEMVNCSEIEQVDINENEGDLKGDGRDEEMVGDSLETAGDKCNEDQLTDSRECSDNQKNTMLIVEEGVNQPGNSEEETITGDTTNQTSTDLAKEKDEEVCIIPDDVISGLSILSESKSITNTEGEDEEMDISKESQTESDKPKTRAQDKKGQSADSKPRPVRNAAKLAGNKIKSLVENDLVFEEQPSGGDVEKEMEIQENVDESTQMCAQCKEVKVCKLLSVQNDNTSYLCSEQCSAAFKSAQMDSEPTESETTLREYVRKCSQCHSEITVDETRLFWETMDFCNEDCLGKFQLELGSNCANCKKSVPSTSLGKYCVRFGYDIKQFCSAVCLEEYKKGLKVCSYCQKDISTGVEGFLAPVGTKGQFKDFCTQSCMEKYDRMSSNKPLPDVIEECAVCSNSKPVQVEVELDNKTHKLCSEPCFAAFKFVNNITEGQCDMCRKYFDRSKIPTFSLRLLFYDETLHSFCSKTCMNVYILANRKIVPCNWCKVKKYNFDMIRKVSSDGQLSMMCSLNCLMLYQTSVNAVCSRPIKCDFCKKKFVRQPLYHLTMSDATLRNFCSYNCVMSFQNGYPKQKIDVIPGPDQLGAPIPTGVPKRLAPKRAQVESTCVPVISSVQSLASPNGPVSPSGRVTIPRGDVNIVPQVGQSLTVQASVAPIPAPPPPQVYQQIITKPAPAKQMKNKSILCKPYSHTKGVSCRPHPCMKETQTDQSLNRKFLIPIPVPIYVPAPMHMFSAPFPVPVPFPLPIPVPIFIPTTRNSAKGIMKEIKKIQEKIPTDPFEAELLMMAEMVAGEKKQDPTDSESEDGNDGDDNGDGTFSPENVDTSNTFGDDVLQMALKMASELEEPAVDMESVLTSNTITTSTQPAVDPNKTLYDQVNAMAMNRGRKRSVRGSRNSAGGTPSKRGRRTSGSVDVPLLPPPEPVPPRTIEVEKPDANMCLKYTFGVNAWRHWVLQKNAELEKAALTNRKIKLFKPELLQLTADELNFSLCLFVKEVRKPNGTEYAPDTIYYLCLGIQQYLFENGRIDNIFTDSYYEKFTDCLDEVAKKFAALYNDSQYIVTRVEEEHLWESKQLGAHSPHVLLSTLMFFNTKHFNLVTVEEHMQLSFSHIMKHWKRNPNTPGVAKVPGSRNVLLRFYPPQSALEANSRKKKVYEQQENEENPLRCPVKLYEFYLSKCPESVKTRNDVFYLLPERSCVPDSPVWYSTMALGKEPLMKMLHRIKMVKEINIALLTS